MPEPQAPKDGDFASYLDGVAKQQEEAPQTVQDVLHGAEPTEEFLKDFRALHAAPPLSDEELAQQALNAPGADGDPSTPE